MRGLLVLFVVGGAYAQTFEIADIHPSPSVDLVMRSTFFAGRYEIHNASLLDLVRTAYSLAPEAIFGGPSWLDTDRFEVIAKTAAQSTEADRALMLRSLLAERFHLVVHQEDRPQDVFTLNAGKHPLLKASENAGRGSCQQPKNDSTTQQPYIVLECRNVTMAQAAGQFRQAGGGYFPHPIVDLTGLTGQFDFTFKWTPKGLLRSASVAAPPISFFDAVEQQLGLKLTAERRPMPAIIVDSVNRTPSPNPPGAAGSLGPLVTEFEAASVKPNQSGAPMRIQQKAGGRFESENVPLKLLISLAWSVDYAEVSGGPKWIESASFDIVAKTIDFPATAPPPFDVMRVPLRALLAERFKLAVHQEAQAQPVWALTVAKGGPKLKAADPATRSGCHQVSGDSAGGAPVVSYACQNTTMAQLASLLHKEAGGYVDHPAIDETGLKGAYDFTLQWTPRSALNGAPRSSGGPSDVASDPSGGISFFEALEKELGLKLESGRKHPFPVLVIDHVEALTGN